MDVRPVKRLLGLPLWRALGQPCVDTRDPMDAYKCCSEIVHIAYRGLSDDRMYMSKRRPVIEIKFYRPNGLRVFCADCRRRIV